MHRSACNTTLNNNRTKSQSALKAIPPDKLSWTRGNSRWMLAYEGTALSHDALCKCSMRTRRHLVEAVGKDRSRDAACFERPYMRVHVNSQCETADNVKSPPRKEARDQHGGTCAGTAHLSCAYHCYAGIVEDAGITPEIEDSGRIRDAAEERRERSVLVAEDKEAQIGTALDNLRCTLLRDHLLARSHRGKALVGNFDNRFGRILFTQDL